MVREQRGLSFAREIATGLRAAKARTNDVVVRTEPPDYRREGRRQQHVHQQRNKSDPAKDRSWAGLFHCIEPRTCRVCPAGAPTSEAQARGRSESRSGFAGGEGGG